MSRTREISERQPLVKPDEAGKLFDGNRGFWAASIALVVCFGAALWRLVLFAWDSELYSYIVLIPFVSGFLVWNRRKSFHAGTAPARSLGALFAGAGLGVLAIYWLLDSSGSKLTVDDRLAFTTLSFLFLFYGVCCFFLKRRTLREALFALGLLVFVVPIPAVVMKGVEAFLQRGSAAVAEGLFWLTGTTFSSENLIFHVPGISFQVAPECSGIHSSVVLLITSLVAGYCFLRSPARRTILAVAVIPLALLRNGLRIFTIGQLCIHVGPEMIDSPFHHHWAGPLFFGLSMIPFLLLLYFLQKEGRPARETKADNSADKKI